MEFDHISKHVTYLLERTAISDVLISFARTLDTKDWEGYASLFTEDAIVEMPVKLPDGSFFRHVGREGLAKVVEGDAHRPGLSHFVHTHHLSANHQIKIDGDAAVVTSYAQCIHRFNEDPSNVWELGGWYFCELRREGKGDWKFAKVRLEKIWEHGNPFNHG